jgi:hypothetical protein
MIAVKIWRLLQDPLEDTRLYQRLVPLSHIDIVRRIALMVLIGCGIVGLTLWLFFPAATILIFVMPLLIAVFDTTIHSGIWSLNIANAIARQQQYGTYDLLATTPIGRFGLHWLIGVGYIQRSGDWARVQAFSIEAFFVALLCAVAMLGSVEIQVERPLLGNTEFFIIMLVFLVAVLAMFYINRVHCVLIGLLLGIVVPCYAHLPMQTRAYTPPIYISILTAIYAVFSILILLIAPRIVVTGIDGALVLAGFLFGTFFTLMHIPVLILWRLIRRELGADLRDIAPLLVKRYLTSLDGVASTNHT